MSVICITGGAGFIGTRLCSRLSQAGKAFKILDIAASERFGEHSICVDICDLDGLRAAVPDNAVLVHLAAVHRDDVRPISRYDDVNVEGARNICRIAREKNVTKIVFTSSVAVYGFAPAGTDESGDINYFNDYGRTKWLAEEVFRAWLAEDPENRTLVTVRPTVVFGEQNRGNVYNLLRQIALGRFVMIGNGKNCKSMAYVENVAAFLEHALDLDAGMHLYNYVDQPDFDMNHLVLTVRNSLGKSKKVGLRMPYIAGLAAGYVLDAVARITGRTFPVSAIRVKKFCATTQFGTSVADTGFVPPVKLDEALAKTVSYEFLEDHSKEAVFYTE